MHYSFSFACPIELLNIYQQTCIILLRANGKVESFFHNVIQLQICILGCGKRRLLLKRT